MKFGLTTLAGIAGALALSTTLAFAGPGEAGHTHKMFALVSPATPRSPSCGRSRSQCRRPTTRRCSSTPIASR